jgi:hypothetical protein
MVLVSPAFIALKSTAVQRFEFVCTSQTSTAHQPLHEAHATACKPASRIPRLNFSDISYVDGFLLDHGIQAVYTGSFAWARAEDPSLASANRMHLLPSAVM